MSLLQDLVVDIWIFRRLYSFMKKIFIFFTKKRSSKPVFFKSVLPRGTKPNKFLKTIQNYHHLMLKTLSAVFEVAYPHIC